MKKKINQAVITVGITNNKNEDKEMIKKEIQNVQKDTLTDAQVNALTNDTVSKLNQLEATNIEGWLAMGEAVHNYVLKLHPEGKYKRDPFVMLAAHPDSYHRPSMLRNYEAAYRLYKELSNGKDGAPKVSLTHFIQVLHLGDNIGDKRNLLIQAEQGKWSVSDLKKYISEERSSSHKKPPKPHNYGIDLKNCLKTMADLISRITIKDKQEITKDTRSQIVSSIQHLITLNVVSFEEINAPALKTAA